MTTPRLVPGSVEARAICELMSNQRLVTLGPAADRLGAACRVVQWLAAEQPQLDILFLVDHLPDLSRLAARLRRRFTTLNRATGWQPSVLVTTAGLSRYRPAGRLTVQVASPNQSRHRHDKPSADLVVIDPEFLAEFDTILVGFNTTSQILLTATVDTDTILDCQAKLSHGRTPSFHAGIEVLLAGAPG